MSKIIFMHDDEASDCGETSSKLILSNADELKTSAGTARKEKYRRAWISAREKSTRQGGH